MSNQPEVASEKNRTVSSGPNVITQLRQAALAKFTSLENILSKEEKVSAPSIQNIIKSKENYLRTLDGVINPTSLYDQVTNLVGIAQQTRDAARQDRELVQTEIDILNAHRKVLLEFYEKSEALRLIVRNPAVADEQLGRIKESLTELSKINFSALPQILLQGQFKNPEKKWAQASKAVESEKDEFIRDSLKEVVVTVATLGTYRYLKLAGYAVKYGQKAEAVIRGGTTLASATVAGIASDSIVSTSEYIQASLLGEQKLISLTEKIQGDLLKSLGTSALGSAANLSGVAVANRFIKSATLLNGALAKRAAKGSIESVATAEIYTGIDLIQNSEQQHDLTSVAKRLSYTGLRAGLTGLVGSSSAHYRDTTANRKMIGIFESVGTVSVGVAADSIEGNQSNLFRSIKESALGTVRSHMSVTRQIDAETIDSDIQRVNYTRPSATPEHPPLVIQTPVGHPLHLPNSSVKELNGRIADAVRKNEIVIKDQTLPGFGAAIRDGNLEYDRIDFSYDRPYRNSHERSLAVPADVVRGAMLSPFGLGAAESRSPSQTGIKPSQIGALPRDDEAKRYVNDFSAPRPSLEWPVSPIEIRQDQPGKYVFELKNRVNFKSSSVPLDILSWHEDDGAKIYQRHLASSSTQFAQPDWIALNANTSGRSARVHSAKLADILPVTEVRDLVEKSRGKKEPIMLSLGLGEQQAEIYDGKIRTYSQTDQHAWQTSSDYLQQLSFELKGRKPEVYQKSSYSIGLTNSLYGLDYERAHTTSLKLRPTEYNWNHWNVKSFVSALPKLGATVFLKPNDSAQGRGVIRVRFNEDGSFQFDTNCRRTALDLSDIFSKDSDLATRSVARFNKVKNFTFGIEDYSGFTENNKGYAKFKFDPERDRDDILKRALDVRMLKGKLVAEGGMQIARNERGQPIEIRLVYQNDRLSGPIQLTGHYAKLGNAAVAGNIAMGGTGKNSTEALTSMFLANDKTLSPFEARTRARDEVARITEKSDRFLNDIARADTLMRELSVAGGRFLVNNESRKISVDIVPIWKGGVVDWHLMEVQNGNIGVKGLGQTNPDLFK